MASMIKALECLYSIFSVYILVFSLFTPNYIVDGAIIGSKIKLIGRNIRFIRELMGPDKFMWFFSS